jgi:predicted DNA-binding transcriptional regulator AlpA
MMSTAAKRSAGNDEHRSFQMERLLLPIPDACAAIGIGRTTLYELVDDKQIVRVHIGRRSFITAESLAAYVDRITEAAHGVPA